MTCEVYNKNTFLKYLVYTLYVYNNTENNNPCIPTIYILSLRGNFVRKKKKIKITKI